MDEDLSPGRALKSLGAVPFVLYGAALLAGVIFESWMVGAIALGAVAIVLWLENKFGVLTAIAIWSAMLVLRIMFWVDSRRQSPTDVRP